MRQRRRNANPGFVNLRREPSCSTTRHPLPPHHTDNSRFGDDDLQHHCDRPTRTYPPEHRPAFACSSEGSSLTGATHNVAGGYYEYRTAPRFAQAIDGYPQTTPEGVPVHREQCFILIDQRKATDATSPSTGLVTPASSCAVAPSTFHTCLPPSHAGRACPKRSHPVRLTAYRFPRGSASPQSNDGSAR